MLKCTSFSRGLWHKTTCFMFKSDFLKQSCSSIVPISSYFCVQCEVRFHHSCLFCMLAKASKPVYVCYTHCLSSTVVTTSVFVPSLSCDSFLEKSAIDVVFAFCKSSDHSLSMVNGRCISDTQKRLCFQL